MCRYGKIKVCNAKTRAVFEEEPLVAIEITERGQKVILAIGSKAHQLAHKPNVIAVNPFSHPRVLFSDFQVGEKVLQYAFKNLPQQRHFGLSPLVVIHPMEKTEGGLTMIEKRAFSELAIGGGAKKAVVYEGNETK